MKKTFINAVSETLLLLALLSLLWYCHPAHAVELKIAYGENLVREAEPGIWNQPTVDGALPSEFHQQTEDKEIEITMHTWMRWLDWSAAYADRGEYYGWGFFVQDKNYNAASLQCMNGCSPVTMGSFSGSTTAVMLTLDPTWRINKVAKLYGQVGVSFFRAKFEEHNTNLHSEDQPDAHPSLGSYPVTHNGESIYAAVGGQYQNIFVKAYYAPKEDAGGDGIARGNKGLVAGYAFQF